MDALYGNNETLSKALKQGGSDGVITVEGRSPKRNKPKPVNAAQSFADDVDTLRERKAAAKGKHPRPQDFQGPAGMERDIDARAADRANRVGAVATKPKMSLASQLNAERGVHDPMPAARSQATDGDGGSPNKYDTSSVHGTF